MNSEVFKSKTWSVILLLLGAILGGWQPALAQESEGESDEGEIRIITVKGSVEKAEPDSVDWKTAKEKDPLQVGWRLRTGRRSKAAIRMSDLSVLRVGQLSTLEIQPPKDQRRKRALDLKAGAAYFFNREGPSKVDFRTPIASGAIRGTEFMLEVDENGRTIVTMFEGEVDLENEFGSVQLGNGEQGTVNPGEAPEKTAVIDAVSVVQWMLYYPGVVDPDDLGQRFVHTEAVQPSLKAYLEGNILKSLDLYPEERLDSNEASAEEQLWLAMLEMSTGLVEQAMRRMDKLQTASLEGSSAEVLDSLKKMARTVQGKVDESWTSERFSTATEWLTHSYVLQSKFDIAGAREAAEKAVELAPDLGYALVRQAELEFASGLNQSAAKLLDRALNVSPENAQALSLRGFIVAGNNDLKSAEELFSQAIELDPALSNAWLGRGLTRHKSGQVQLALDDMQVAVTMAPTRAILRSYLSKIYRDRLSPEKALKELEIAKALDPNDPTAWMYSALMQQQENKIVTAVDELEVSRELNENRGVYRSRFLLDQDRAAKGANLALVYKDAGMLELSAREASRAVATDYTSAASHLFLANSYDVLRDPRQVNLRYETGWLGELLIANLLAPVGSGTLSQNVSLQEYSKLLERDRPRFTSYTEYTSGGNWWERSSIYGSYRDMEYSLDSNYRWDNGQRSNNDIEEINWIGKFKYQVTPKDQVFLQVVTQDLETGDGSQYFDNVNQGSDTLRVEERSEPALYAGWNHEWAPGNHFLGLVGRVDQSTAIMDDLFYPLLVSEAGGMVTEIKRDDGSGSNTPRNMSQDFQRDWELYSMEAQQVFTRGSFNTILGVRYQTGDVEINDHLDNLTPGGFPPVYSDPVSSLYVEGEMNRVTGYFYETWKVNPTLTLTGGVAVDYMEHPVNADSTPVSSEDTERKQISPKAGLIWSPTTSTMLRASYTHSLGGLFFDNGIRLEPTQVGGFLQSYRSLAPESLAGLLSGATFRIAGVGIDHQFKSNTYLGLEGQWLRSDGDSVTGGYLFRQAAGTAQPIDIEESVEYEEKTLAVNLYQLLGESLTLGTRYRISLADYYREFTQYSQFSEARNDFTGLLHQNTFYSYYYHPSGWFGQAEAVWSLQSPRNDLRPLDGDEFWQFHLYAGYRMWQRRLEAKVGIMNIADQQYQLHPINWYYELPRERTFFASLKLNF